MGITQMARKCLEKYVWKGKSRGVIGQKTKPYEEGLLAVRSRLSLIEKNREKDATLSGTGSSGRMA